MSEDGDEDLFEDFQDFEDVVEPDVEVVVNEKEEEINKVEEIGKDNVEKAVEVFKEEIVVVDKGVSDLKAKLMVSDDDEEEDAGKKDDVDEDGIDEEIEKDAGHGVSLRDKLAQDSDDDEDEDDGEVSEDFFSDKISKGNNLDSGNLEKKETDGDSGGLRSKLMQEDNSEDNKNDDEKPEDNNGDDESQDLFDDFEDKSPIKVDTPQNQRIDNPVPPIITQNLDEPDDEDLFDDFEDFSAKDPKSRKSSHSLNTPIKKLTPAPPAQVKHQPPAVSSSNSQIYSLLGEIWQTASQPELTTLTSQDQFSQIWSEYFKPETTLSQSNYSEQLQEFDDNDDDAVLYIEDSKAKDLADDILLGSDFENVLTLEEEDRLK